MATRQTAAILVFAVQRAQFSFDCDCDTGHWEHTGPSRGKIKTTLHSHF